jgi:hypothetical protein
MTYTAENQGANFWIVSEVDDEGNTVKTHNVFCAEAANTAEDAIALLTAEPAGDPE